MCEPVSIGMAIVAVAGAAMSAKEKAKGEGAAQDAQNRTGREQVKQAHMANAELSLTAADRAEEARQQLTEVNMQALKNKGTIRAAIGESGLSGNSMRRIANSVDNEASQQKMNITDNYRRDYQSIFANQIVNVENTKSALNGQAQVLRTSGVSHALGIVSAGANGYAQGTALKGQMDANKANAKATGQSTGTAKGGTA